MTVRDAAAEAASTELGAPSSIAAMSVGGGSPLGPLFLHRAGDDVVVGEIGGGFVGAGVVEFAR